MSASIHIPWTAYRIGEKGFAGGYDVYAVRDSRGTEIACGLKKEAAELIAAAPELLEAVDDALGVLIGCCIPAGGVDDRKSILDCQAKLRALLKRISP